MPPAAPFAWLRPPASARPPARCNAWQPWADCVLEMRGKLPMNPILRPLKKLARFIQNPVEALNAIPLSLFGGESFLSSGYVSDF